MQQGRIFILYHLKIIKIPKKNSNALDVANCFTKASSSNLPALETLTVVEYLAKDTRFVSSVNRSIKLTRAAEEKYGDSSI